MSAKEQIGRLQQLLERVQMRAQEPRANGGAAHALAPGMAAQATPQVSAPPAYFPPPLADYAPPVTRTQQPPAATYPTSPPPGAAYPATSPPPSANAYPTSPPPETDAYEDGEMEVSSETVEIDIDIDEPMPMESGAQPVAQQTMPPDDLEDELDEQPMATQPLARPDLDDEVTQMVAPAPANEVEEPAPSSSRRPIAAEEVAEPYGEESAPRHTPPPESGKQVAAPSVHPSSVRPSAPPPSLGGHALQAGWREPGLGVPEISPSAGAARPPPAPTAAAQASGTRLSPDVMRPDLSATGANVATFEAAPIAKPTTMGELLDLTLSL